MELGLTTSTPTDVVVGHGLVGVLDLDLARWLPPLTADARRGVILLREGLGHESFAPNITVELRPIDDPAAPAADFELPPPAIIVQSGPDDEQVAGGTRLSVSMWGPSTVVQLERWLRTDPGGPVLWLVCSALDTQWPLVAADFDRIADSARVAPPPEGNLS